jgi:heavy metal translocating P-type ATPase
MKVETDPANSEYQKIIEMVANALENKPKIVTLASKYSIYFSAISIILAFAAYLITEDVRTIAEVLVLATPCPLLIAAPVAFLGGINAGAKRGIIFKNSSSLQTLADMKTVAFDKTGTLTVGFPVLERVEVVDSTYTSDTILQLAKALEKYSSHPLAKAFTDLKLENENAQIQISDVKEIAGVGIEGKVSQFSSLQNSKQYKIAIRKSASNQADIDLESNMSSLFFINEKHIATFLFADKIKADSIKTIRNLKEFHIRKVAMLTGDTEPIAKKTAHEVGVDKVFANLKPEQKVEVVKSLEPKPVLFVGDGINDAPVLASADLGLAISHGNLSAAAETADIVIGGDHLCDIDYCFLISEKTLRIAKQSMIGGIALSVIAMIIAAFGFIPAIYGAIGQELIDIFAIANGLRAAFIKKQISNRSKKGPIDQKRPNRPKKTRYKKV